jgi:hypothetical protein
VTDMATVTREPSPAADRTPAMLPIPRTLSRDHLRESLAALFAH